MNAATATIDAHMLRTTGRLEKAEYRSVLQQLRYVTERLNVIERRLEKEERDPVELAKIIDDAVSRAVQPLTTSGPVVEVPQDILVQGPAKDLREMISALVDHACSSGARSVAIRAQVLYSADQARPMCATEIGVQSKDFPDFLRRRLWDTIHERRGELSVSSELSGYRITFTLPVERRLGTVLG